MIKLEAGDCLSPETVDLIERIAREDGTTFEVAMMGYDMMVDAIHDAQFTEHKYAKKHRREGDEFDPQVMAERILASRATMGVHLATAVRLLDAEADGSSQYGRRSGNRFAPMQSQLGTRTCRIEGCDQKVAAESYYRCTRHLEELPPDDGELVYCCPPPKALKSMMEKGYRKLMAEHGGKVIVEGAHAMVTFQGVDVPEEAGILEEQ